MSATQVYFQSFLIIMSMMSILWLVSIALKNVSIVDIFWGSGFVLSAWYYFLAFGDFSTHKIIIVSLVTIWGLRLSAYLAWRNIGKPEDFRYQEFRRKYGAHRYWWVSFFQTFLLQGTLVWIISLPLFGAFKNTTEPGNYLVFGMGLLVWIVGFVFEAGGDFQLARFKANPANKGKVLNTGFWRYTRHPNYFGDSAVWWAYGLFSIAYGGEWYALGSVLMTALIIKVSGVALLEKTLKNTKPEYEEYIRNTSAFIPRLPRKNK